MAKQHRTTQATRPAGEGRLWPQITSPIAREIVAEAHRAIPRAQRQRAGEYDPEGEDKDAYRRWLRRALRKANLGERLALGETALPDITGTLPEPLRSVYRLARPRSYRQLVRHLIHYLDWYADPRGTIRPYACGGKGQKPRWIFLLWTSPALLLIASIEPYAPAMGTWLFMLTPLASFVIITMRLGFWGLAAHPLARRLRSTVLRDINAQELYRHLRISYSESHRHNARNLAGDLR